VSFLRTRILIRAELVEQTDGMNDHVRRLGHAQYFVKIVRACVVCSIADSLVPETRAEKKRGPGARTHKAPQSSTSSYATDPSG
jgi:hypothetical protein